MCIFLKSKLSIRDFATIIILFSLICLTCACNSNNAYKIEELMSQAGTVQIFSGGEDFTPLGNLINCLKDGVFGDGVRKHVDEVVDELSIIPYKDDFKIIIGGKGKAYNYTLYNRKLEEVYSRKSEFTVPQENGEFIVYFEASWGNDKEYVGYQFFFKIVK